jgi:hypothetical protein
MGAIIQMEWVNTGDREKRESTNRKGEQLKEGH